MALFLTATYCYIFSAMNKKQLLKKDNETSTAHRHLNSILQQVKEYKIELAAVDAWREQAETLQADLDKLQSSLSRYEHREEKYRGEIEALEAEIEAYHQAMRKVGASKFILLLSYSNSF